MHKLIFFIMMLMLITACKTTQTPEEQRIKKAQLAQEYAEEKALKVKANIAYKTSIENGSFSTDTFTRYNPLNDFEFDKNMNKHCIYKKGSGNHSDYQREFDAEAQCSCNYKISYQECRKNNARKKELGLKTMQYFRNLKCNNEEMQSSTYQYLYSIKSDIKSAQTKHPNNLSLFKKNAFSSIERMCKNSVYQAQSYPLEKYHSNPYLSLPGICFVSNQDMAKSLNLATFHNSNVDQNTDKCISYFTSQYKKDIDNHIVKQKQLKKNKESKIAKQKARKKAKKEALALKNKQIKAFESLLAKKVYSKNDSLVKIDSTAKGYSHDIADIKGQILFSVMDWYKKANGNDVAPFSPPIKKEFETSVDYQQRLSLEEKKYNESIIKRKQILEKQKYTLLSQALPLCQDCCRLN